MNKPNNIKKCLFALVMCLSFSLCGCGSNDKTEEIVINYGDAESFEVALDEGENCCLTRKMQKIDTQNTKKSTLCKKAS